MWKEGRASFYVIENCMSLLTKKIKNKSKKKEEDLNKYIYKKINSPKQLHFY